MRVLRYCKVGGSSAGQAHRRGGAAGAPSGPVAGASSTPLDGRTADGLGGLQILLATAARSAAHCDVLPSDIKLDGRLRPLDWAGLIPACRVRRQTVWLTFSGRDCNQHAELPSATVLRNPAF